ncbi:hypothetical protein QJS10_CPA09g00692 [Acorus calamus]|uniref:Uncharacterized protein n=1 Tax=Acorus calamus TaxID=4465 RepID=A0AAV9E7Y4_ACOCL|nr:hypothetical protein QJS10_CPA09g00692 [Acorus calamus]
MEREITKSWLGWVTHGLMTAGERVVHGERNLHYFEGAASAILASQSQDAKSGHVKADNIVKRHCPPNSQRFNIINTNIIINMVSFDEIKLHKLAIIQMLRERIYDNDAVIREELHNLLKKVIFPILKEVLDNYGEILRNNQIYLQDKSKLKTALAGLVIYGYGSCVGRRESRQLEPKFPCCRARAEEMFGRFVLAHADGTSPRSVGHPLSPIALG